MKTLEDYFKDENKKSGAIDHSLRCCILDEQVFFYIHPQDRDGDSLDFRIDGNTLTPCDPDGNPF